MRTRAILTCGACWAIAAATGATAHAQQSERREVRVVADDVVLEGIGDVVVNEEVDVDRDGDVSFNVVVDHSPVWIGVQCQRIPEALRPALKLPDGAGVVVAKVVEKSPAAEAGLKTGDILLSVTGVNVDSAEALVRAVQKAAKDDLTLEFLREGERLELTVTPAVRDDEAGKQERGRVGLRAILPGVVLRGPGELAPRLGFQRDSAPAPGSVHLNLTSPLAKQVELPDDVTVSITRTGKSPAKVIVRRGEQTLEYEAEEFDELPKDVRAYVRALSVASPSPRVESFYTFFPEAEVQRRVAILRKKGDEAAQAASRAAAEAANAALKQAQRELVEHEDDAKALVRKLTAELQAKAQAAQEIDVDQLEKRVDKGFSALQAQIDALQKAIDRLADKESPGEEEEDERR